MSKRHRFHILLALGVVGLFAVSIFVSKSVLAENDALESNASSTPDTATSTVDSAVRVDTVHASSLGEEPAEDMMSQKDLPPVYGDAGHVVTPAVVRGIYMSQCMAGAPRLRQSLIDFVDSSSLNTLVIDIKDFSGGIGFPTDDPLLAEHVSNECGASDMKSLVESLHKKGIYVIGRITVFQDPLYAKKHPSQAVQSSKGGVWKNYGGLSFVDVGSKPFWDYIVRLSQVSYREMGFDELNFDYIRYPSDGPLKEAVYTLSGDKTKVAALTEFYKYLHAQLQPEGSVAGKDAPVISADMFGMVSSHQDDLGIGQTLESAFPYFDYIDPMIYPSHYPKGFDGYENVNAHYYDVVRNETKAAVARAIEAGYEKEKIRAWLQSFDYPVAYTPAMVRGQIEAQKEGGGLDSYLFWDAANKYTSLRQVLQ